MMMLFAGVIMARIRTVKPEFWQNEELANCSAHARLLAIAVLQLADCQGRLKWIPMQIHAHAFPFENNLKIDKLAAELCKISYIEIYSVSGKKYAEIPNFNKHQRLTGKEAATKSQIPPSNDPNATQGSSSETSVKHLDAQEGEGEGEGEEEREGVPKKPKGSTLQDRQVTWDSYDLAYFQRYGVEPVRNKKVNSQIKQFVERIGAADAPHVAAYFLGSADAYYTKRGHSVDLLLHDAEKLRMEWATNARITTEGSRQADKEQTRGSNFAQVAAELEGNKHV